VIRQRLVRHDANRAQRMRDQNEIVQLAHGKQTFGECVGAAHNLLEVGELLTPTLPLSVAMTSVRGISAAC
jgi:hypothetical protein